MLNGVRGTSKLVNNGEITQGSVIPATKPDPHQTLIYVQGGMIDFTNANSIVGTTYLATDNNELHVINQANSQITGALHINSTNSPLFAINNAGRFTGDIQINGVSNPLIDISNGGTLIGNIAIGGKDNAVTVNNEGTLKGDIIIHDTGTGRAIVKNAATLDGRVDMQTLSENNGMYMAGPGSTIKEVVSNKGILHLRASDKSMITKIDAKTYKGFAQLEVINGNWALTNPGAYTAVSLDQANIFVDAANNVANAPIQVITNSTLQLSTNSALSLANNVVLLPNAVLAINTQNRQSLLLTGGLSGGGSLHKQGSGLLTLSSKQDTILNQLNIEEGNAVLSGSLALNQLNIGEKGTLEGNGGTLIAAKDAATFLSGSGIVNLGANGLAVNSNGHDIEITTAIQGKGSLTKEKRGTLTLSGQNSYQGNTFIDGGKLLFTHPPQENISPIYIQDTATYALNFKQNYTLKQALNMEHSATLAFNLYGNEAKLANGFSLFIGTLELEDTWVTLPNSTMPIIKSPGYATLSLKNNGIAKITGLNHDFDYLILNGGTVQFDISPDNTTPYLMAKVLSGSKGTIKVDLPNAVDTTPANATTLIDQTHNAQLKLIDAQVRPGDTPSLELLDKTGHPLGELKTAVLTDSTGQQAMGSYHYSLKVSNDGVWLGYSLTKVDLQNRFFTISDKQAKQNTVLTTLTGAGAITFEGTQSTPLLLGKTSDYTGMTIIHGAVQLGADRAFGNTVKLMIFDGGTVDLNGKTQSVGALTSLGAMGTVSASRLNLNSGSLTVNQGGEIAGLITGEGDLNFIGDEVAIKGVNPDLRGTINIGSANVTVANNQGLGQARVSLSERGTLNLLSNQSAFNNVLAGKGIVKIAANAMITAMGDNQAFTGHTEVAGQLTINGQWGGALSIVKEGRLQGSGVVGDTLVQEKGILAPGNSIGTLTINGDLMMQAGSVFEADIDSSGQNDRIDVTGAAHIQADLAVIKAKGIYTAGTRYTLLSAEKGVTGALANITQNLPFVALALSQDTHYIYLDITRNASAFNKLALKSTQASVAQAIENLAVGHVLYDNVSSVPDVPSALHAFNTLAGEIYASTQSFLFHDSGYLRNTTLHHLHNMTANDHAPAVSHSWGEAYGNWGHYVARQNVASIDYRQNGVVVGSDRVVDNWHIGGVAGYAQSILHASDNSQANLQHYHLGFYAGSAIDILTLRLGGAYSWYTIAAERYPTIGNQRYNNNTTYHAHTLQAFGELSYPFTLATTNIVPFINTAYVQVKNHAFQEEGSITALSGTRYQNNTLFSTLGTWIDSAFILKHTNIILQSHIGWQHAYGNKIPAVNLTFADSKPFTIRSTLLARDMALLGVGVQLQLAKHAKLALNYTGMIGKSVQGSSAQGNILWTF